MGKRERLKRPSAEDERNERIMKFIQENRPTPAPEKKTTKVLKKPPTGTRLHMAKTTSDAKKTDNPPCLSTTPTMDPRLAAGENNPAARKQPGKLPRTDSECQFQAPGVHFLKARNTNLTEQVLVFKPSKPIRKELKNKCDFFPRYVHPSPFKDQTTQTLYRETSAQTLAYLPEVWRFEGNTRELFTLPSVLPGDKPPGLYEVEVLERSRRRWSFLEALKANRKRLKLDEKKLVVQKYKPVMEAFEWEHWIEREEAIQQCQMMRLQIVIKMFDKREREMHAASKTRIEQACERIEMRRQKGLRKNEIEFQRGIRRLNNQVLSKQPKWKKETPMEALGLPCSEFYGPHMRYGVDPARRHFVSQTGQRAFDARIDKLEQEVNLRGLKCPFRKLKEWSQPKQYSMEAEKNITNEDFLHGLYKGLRSLREVVEFTPNPPECLKKKFRREFKNSRMSMYFPMQLSDLYDKNEDKPQKATQRSLSRLHKTFAQDLKHIQAENHHEDLQYLLSSYEGSAIGGIMQFLWEETARLKQLRKFHFLSLLAENERWVREAEEAGLRQKENDLRLLYEEIFQQTVHVNHEVTDQYIRSILTDDVDSIAGMQAAEVVTEMAKQIDVDIERWLESFKLIQNPLNYIPLRLMLRDMVSPDLNAVLRRHESNLIAQYIVEDVIFGRVWQELEPFDVATTLTSDLIDRLIDNDLYLFSTDSECESPRKTSWYEAQAIIRKLIRQSVPGRRWKEETERIVYENYNDLLDDVFAEIIFNAENPKPMEPIQLQNIYSYGNLKEARCIREREFVVEDPSSLHLFTPQASLDFGTQVLNLIMKRKSSNEEPIKEYKQSQEERFVVMETFSPPALEHQENSVLFPDESLSASEEDEVQMDKASLFGLYSSSLKRQN